MATASAPATTVPRPVVTMPPATAAPDPAPDPPAAPPPVPADAELGEGVVVRAFRPARYAADVNKRVVATHARNWYRERARTSFVLTFSAHGSVRGCRGKRVDSTNDGPHVHNSERFREQQGYHGHWQLEGGWVQVDLTPDPDACPAQRGYVDVAPRPWRLRCLAVEPQGHPVLGAPALVCQLLNRTELRYDEGWGHLVPGVLPDRWLVLGAGNGLRVTWESTSVSPRDEPTVTVRAAPDPVRDDTWEQD